MSPTATQLDHLLREIEDDDPVFPVHTIDSDTVLSPLQAAEYLETGQVEDFWESDSILARRDAEILATANRLLYEHEVTDPSGRPLTIHDLDPADHDRLLQTITDRTGQTPEIDDVAQATTGMTFLLRLATDIDVHTLADGPAHSDYARELLSGAGITPADHQLALLEQMATAHLPHGGDLVAVLSGNVRSARNMGRHGGYLVTRQVLIVDSASGARSPAGDMGQIRVEAGSVVLDDPESLL